MEYVLSHSLRNEVRVIEGKIIRKNYLKGKEIHFEFSRGLSYRGFKVLRLNLHKVIYSKRMEPIQGKSMDVTKTRNGEPGTGNRERPGAGNGEQKSGNERSAVFHIKIQNGGRENSPGEKRTTEIAKYTVNLT